MEFTAAIITVSDRIKEGKMEDKAFDGIKEILENNDWKVIYNNIVPDELEDIAAELKHCADDLDIALVITSGGTGFYFRDVTPEATKMVIDRETPGIAEAMRAESMRITPKGCLSREVAGIRKHTLIVNLPGSRKASQECLQAVIDPLRHGVGIMRVKAEDIKK